MENLFFRNFGSGYPLIILHGLFGASDNWISIGKMLAERYEVFIPDQRNHGRSFKSNDFNYEVMVKDLLKFISINGITNPSIMGHSMGGKVAMKFAIDHTEKLNKLIVVDIAPKYYPVSHQQILAGMLSLNLNAISSRKEADQVLAKYVIQHQIRQFLLKNLTRTTDGKFEWKINLGVINDNIEVIGREIDPGEKFDGATLFIDGDDSDYIREEDHALIAAMFPNSKIENIANAGHWIHAEQPQKFSQVVLDFLSK